MSILFKIKYLIEEQEYLLIIIIFLASNSVILYKIMQATQLGVGSVYLIITK
jgi:hypothetical protein